MPLKRYIHYGCGLDAPVTWMNFDASPTVFSQRLPIVGKIFRKFSSVKFPLNVEYGNIIRGLPIQDETCEAIYCSHVLEHLSLVDFRVALKNTFSYLKTGGTFRFVVPDLECIAQNYLASNDANACSLFMQHCNLGRETRNKHFQTFLREWLGHNQHLWMWDFKGLAEELKSIGFQKIRRAEFGDAHNEKFQEVEKQEPWQNSVGVECLKC